MSSKATELVKFCSNQRDNVDAFSPGTNTDLKTVCGAHVIVSVNQKTPDSAGPTVREDIRKARKATHELLQVENRFSLPCGHCGRTTPLSSRGGSIVVGQAENDQGGTKDDATTPKAQRPGDTAPTRPKTLPKGDTGLTQDFKTSLGIATGTGTASHPPAPPSSAAAGVSLDQLNKSKGSKADAEADKSKSHETQLRDWKDDDSDDDSDSDEESEEE